MPNCSRGSRRRWAGSTGLGAADEATFRTGLLASVPALRRFALSLAREPAAADDLVQDALLRAWRGRGGFEPGTNLEAWLFTILRNVFYSRHRRQTREVSDSDGDYAGRLAAAPEQGGHLDLQDVRAALDRLAPVMREALVLVGIENLSYEEAAAVCGVPDRHCQEPGLAGAGAARPECSATAGPTSAATA